jgi:hypothetical protein
MSEPDLSQTAPQRAWADAKAMYQTTPFQVVGAVLGVAVGIYLRGFLEGAAATLALFITVWLWAAAKAPYRQRDEARELADGFLSKRKGKKDPDLSIRIEQIVWGPIEQGPVAFVFNLSVSNTGEPSIADDFQVWLTIDEKPYKLRLLIIPKNLILGPVTLTQDDMIWDRTCNTPIPRGGKARGWIFAVPQPKDVAAITMDSVKPGALVEIYCEDVKKHRVSASKALSFGEGVTSELVYYPDGSGARLVRRKPEPDDDAASNAEPRTNG